MTRKKTLGLLVVGILFVLTSFTNFLPQKSEEVIIAAGIQNPVVGLNLGNLAPEIIQNDPSGKPIKLSSLKGKVVLLDFWASWCRPCRYENPTLVKAYQQYKDKKFTAGKGLTIYSVSLDANSEAWKQAIEKDGLAWENHVSDLQGWASAPAVMYGVNSIPSNYLLNEKGIIINKNLHGQDLIDALDKLEKK